MNNVFLKICKIDEKCAKEIVRKTYDIAESGAKKAWETNAGYWKQKGYKTFHEKWLEDTVGKGTILDRWKHGQKIKLKDIYKAWVENLFVRAQGTATYRTRRDEEQGIEGKLERELKKITREFDPYHTKDDVSKEAIFELMNNDKKQSWAKKKDYNNGHPGMTKAIFKGAELLTRYNGPPSKHVEKFLNEVRDADEKYDLEEKWNYVEKYVTGKGIDNEGKIHEYGNIPMVSNAMFCSFLLRLGVKNFVKPDYALKQLFCNDDFLVFRLCDDLAKLTDKCPRTIDKIFWLVGSKMAVKDKHIDKKY